MSQQTIELSGIVRNLPDGTVKDGTMQELINLRPRDGALRPVGKKSRIASMPQDVRFIHTINDEVKVYVGASGNYLAYWVYVNDVLNSSAITTATKSNEMKFASLRNTLMISNLTTEETILLLFDNANQTYILYDEIPEIPRLTFWRMPVTGDDEDDTHDTSLEGNWGEAELAQYVKIQKEKAENGYLTGVVLVRAAWELFDGTLVKHTTPVLCPTSELSITGSVVGSVYRLAWGFDAYSINYLLAMTSGELNNLINTYRGVIRGLKIYITLPKSPELIYTGEKETIERGSGVLKFLRKVVGIPQPSYVSDIVYDVSKLSTYTPDPIMISEYYLLKEYKLAELKTGIMTAITNDTVLDLAVREQLTIDNYTHHTLHGKSLFAYNERIFLGNIRNTLYGGKPLGQVILPDAPFDYSTPYNIGIEYDIITSDKNTLTVFTGWTESTFYNTAKTKMKFKTGIIEAGHVGYLGYPDSRAIAARILVSQGNVVKLVGSVTLNANPALNFAIITPKQYEVTFSSLVTYSLVPNKNHYYDYNRVQATELNNPFYFPAINSYRVGNGTILGMSTNAVALSQGQFGQFPIFCFTTDGIWTTNIGDGETLINTIRPLSRAVCNNPSSIVPIDGGTAFTTTKGLFIIAGTDVIEISDLAEGAHKSRITGTYNYEAIVNNPNLYQIKDYLCPVPFLSYIAGAKIAWDHGEDHKELVVSNSSYNYSWVYNLKHKMWCKVSQVWENFVPDYPRTYGYRTKDTTYYQDDLSEEDFSEFIPVHIETRPLKLSTKAFKMINRILVQGDISEPKTPFSVNLFGSVNKIDWYLMNNGKIFPNGYVPLLLGRTTFSCRYFILVLGGMVDENFYITHLEVDFDERYGNKLR